MEQKFFQMRSTRMEMGFCGSKSYFVKKTFEAYISTNVSSSNPDASSTQNTQSKTTDRNSKSERKESNEKSEHEILFGQGNDFYRAKDFNKAIIFYSEAIEKCPPEMNRQIAMYFKNRAAAYRKLKMWSKVVENLNSAIELDSKYENAYLSRALAYEALNLMADCVSDALAVCVLEYFKDEATISFTKRVLEASALQDAKKHFQTIKVIQPSNWSIRAHFRTYAAHPLMKMISEKKNQHSNVKGFMLAKWALDREKYEKIIPACTVEIESLHFKAKYKAEALLLRGTLYSLSKCFDSARQDLNLVIHDVDADLNLRIYALLERAYLNYLAEEKDKCMADFEIVKKVVPNCADLYILRAKIFSYVKDQLPLAVSDLKRVTKLVPAHAIGHVLKYFAEAMTSLSKNQTELSESISGLWKCLNKFPECIECYTCLAQLSFVQRQFEVADQLLKEAIEMEPDNGALYLQRAILLRKWKEDPAMVRELLEQAIAVDSRNGIAHEMLGMLVIQQGKMELAIESFEKAIKFTTRLPLLIDLFKMRNAIIAKISAAAKLGRNKYEVLILSENVGI